MNLEDGVTERLIEKITITLTSKQFHRWEQQKKELKELNGGKMSILARNSIVELMDQVDALIEKKRLEITNCLPRGS